ncbi:MAG: restriction endonuclease subunit S [Acidobacteria bacterium]|nr:restriction endonuclease subunit S [Acidobacteriota bacterium]
MSFPPYPKYKPSGVEWLGDVPEHWEVWKMAHAFSVIGSGTTPRTDNRTYYDEGDIPWVNTGDLNDGILEACEKHITRYALAEHSSLKLYAPESILIAMYGATIGKLGRLSFPATVNQACCVLSGISSIDPSYIFFWFVGLRQQILSLATGGGQPNISQDIIRSLRVGCPPLVEQTQIAAFLDRETGKIDELVAEQRRLIELLKEKRQAVISHAVTRGLNPNAPTKPSGIQWLGNIPEHWEILATKRFFRLIVEPAPNDNDFELLSIYTDIGVRPRKELEAKGNKATTTDGYWKVKMGDIIVNKLLAWMGAIGVSNYDGVTSPAYDILRKTRPLEPRYFDYLFRCGICFTEFRRHSRGIMDMRLRLYFEEFGQLPMPFPPDKEQVEIVAFLEGETAKLDALTAEAERAIELLQERRTALISSAVTGKIDVRNAV